MAKRLVLLALIVVPIVAGCASTEVKPEQIDSYQNAGLKPGETVQKATGG